MNLFEEKKLGCENLLDLQKIATCDKIRFATLAKLKSTQAGNHDINLVYDSNKSQVDIYLKPNETKEYTNLTRGW